MVCWENHPTGNLFCQSKVFHHSDGASFPFSPKLFIHFGHHDLEFYCKFWILQTSVWVSFYISPPHTKHSEEDSPWHRLCLLPCWVTEQSWIMCAFLMLRKFVAGVKRLQLRSVITANPQHASTEKGDWKYYSSLCFGNRVSASELKRGCLEEAGLGNLLSETSLM